MTIYPTILTNSINEFQNHLDLVKNISSIKVIQVDIIDGYFADNITLTPSDLLAINFDQLQVDCHLMVNEPMDYVVEIEDILDKVPVRAIIAQVERMSFPQDYIEEVKKMNKKVGMSFDVDTPLNAIEKKFFTQLDMVQLMGVEVGFQGQAFQGKILAKIKKLKTLISNNNWDIEIVVDGGVKLENAQAIMKAGAGSLAVGSQLWKSKNIAATIAQF